MFFLTGKPRVGFKISLAEVPIEVHARYSQTKKFCRDYLTDELGDVQVFLNKKHIWEERKISQAQAKKEGRFPWRYVGSYLETLALCREVTLALIHHDVLLFHGAVMAVGGKAYLFTAKSGTGKTTHCQLWLKNIPNCHILNGDKPLLRFKDGQVDACGSPWMGKENHGINEILPLAAICLLERDETNHVQEITLKEGFEPLITQSHIPTGKGNFAKAVSLVQQLQTVKLYRLGCNMNDEAAMVAYEAIVEHKITKEKEF